MWRVRIADETDVVVRLPRRPHAAAQVEREMALLERISRSSLSSVVSTPTVRHVGEAHEAFHHRWSVLDWIDGSDAWSARHVLDADQDQLAVDLAEAVLAIRMLTDMRTTPRTAGSRGGPIEPLLLSIDRWLDDPVWRASDLVDVGAIRRLANEALEVVNEPVEVGFVHGDLIPGNILVTDRRLSAIIDWGGAGHGDLAQDLAPAWAVLDARSRESFRRAVGVDEATWIRARTFELEHAVGGVLYYGPRRHVLGDIMARTLDRILSHK